MSVPAVVCPTSVMDVNFDACVSIKDELGSLMIVLPPGGEEVGGQ